ncbi:hypothetical protein VINI7043_27350 [Vibrio nigripulchritudo ATCC 27043]|nr:hypothetical protein VINI7043_27350 [Vibrio nigripulchritudo ATCC 27043]KJY81189.1 hypothetical protein TW74_02580 [Vibrio nigripulchritudo]BCL69093.1 hypothetical protein VNTUMSATTG_10300 [Vibrio nigripulchritudo]BDU30425.1 hypothetical protein TUMSATVNIG1_10340 [Vibrio nigripulchritudo]
MQQSASDIEMEVSLVVLLSLFVLSYDCQIRQVTLFNKVWQLKCPRASLPAVRLHRKTMGSDTTSKVLNDKLKNENKEKDNEIFLQ